jgi:hypothetical protein
MRVQGEEVSTRQMAPVSGMSVGQWVGIVLATLALLISLYLSVGFFLNGGRHCLSPYAKILPLPLEQRAAAFALLRPEDAYDVYVCGLRVYHPSTQDLAEPFARIGPAALPLLRRRLVDAESEYTAVGILSVFAEAQRLHVYSVNSDPDLMRNARTIADRMTSPAYRRMAERALQRIAAPDGVGPLSTSDSLGRSRRTEP